MNLIKRKPDIKPFENIDLYYPASQAIIPYRNNKLPYRQLSNPQKAYSVSAFEIKTRSSGNSSCKFTANIQ